MFLKFFKLKKGKDEAGSIDYCLNNPTARIVRGDPSFVKWIIDHTPLGLRQRFVAGVISVMTKLDAINEHDMINGFHKQMLAGRHESSMPFCIIGHEDKGRHELHFVAPLYDLMFGKLVHPYIDRIDRYRFAAWVEWFALKTGLEYSGDHLRTKPAFEHLRLRDVDKEFLEDIWQQVNSWVEAGAVTSHDELVRKFAETKHQVRFDGYNGKPLQQPVILGPDGNPLRLTNSIYYRPDYGPELPKPLDRSDDAAVKKRILAIEEKFMSKMDFRAHHLIGRLFGAKEQKVVAKGKARLRLKHLINQKIDQQRTRNALWDKIKVEDVFEKFDLNKSETPFSNYTPVQKPLTAAENEEQSLQVANVPDNNTNHNSDESLQFKTTVESAPDGQPEAFPPQDQAQTELASGEQILPENPTTKPVIAKTRRRQRHTPEIDLPPL
jgi:hypothetical protein